MYPRIFAKAIVKGIIKEKGLPVEIPTYHVSEIEERPSEESKGSSSWRRSTGNNGKNWDPQTEENRISWKAVLDNLKIDLPKSGVKTWTNPLSQLFKDVQTLLPQYRIGAIKAGKGLDRFILGDQGWVDDLPRRYTVIMQRLNREILDLGEDDCSKMSKLQQHRQAKPSHVMICVFAERSIRDQNAIEPGKFHPCRNLDGFSSSRRSLLRNQQSKHRHLDTIVSQYFRSQVFSTQWRRTGYHPKIAYELRTSHRWKVG